MIELIDRSMIVMKKLICVMLALIFICSAAFLLSRVTRSGRPADGSRGDLKVVSGAFKMERNAVYVRINRIITKLRRRYGTGL